MPDLIFEAVETIIADNGSREITVPLWRCGPPGEMESDADGSFVGTQDECLRYLEALEQKRATEARLHADPARMRAAAYRREYRARRRA